MLKNIKIVYFSGTGGTELVANTFKEKFEQAGINVKIEKLTHLSLARGKKFNYKQTFLMLVFPVHAFNAPDIVYKWIATQPRVNLTPTYVISVSGGGEVSPNTACRVKAIKHLEKRGFNVQYEQMLVMPSNFGVATNKSISTVLLSVLPSKVEKIVKDIVSQKIRRVNATKADRVISFLGVSERYGAKLFGRYIKPNESCTGCGWCANNCPSGNIKMVDQRPKFGFKCSLCLGCLYGCPANALSPRIGKSFVIKEGFNIKNYQIDEDINFKELIDLNSIPENVLWGGVKKYLSEGE